MDDLMDDLLIFEEGGVYKHKNMLDVKVMVVAPEVVNRYTTTLKVRYLTLSGRLLADTVDEITIDIDDEEHWERVG